MSSPPAQPQPPTVRIRTLVLPGGRVEVSSPQLKEGEAVEVDIRSAAGSPASDGRRSALDAIDALGGHRLFRSPREVDAHIEEERDSWR